MRTDLVPVFEEEYIPEIEHYDDKSVKDTVVENNSNIAEKTVLMQ